MNVSTNGSSHEQSNAMWCELILIEPLFDIDEAQ